MAFFRPGSRLKKVFGLLGFILFIAGTAISVRQVSRIEATFDPVPLLVVILVLAPMTLHLSVRRFQYLGTLAGLNEPYSDSARVVISGRLANILPLPGSLMVRYTYLTQRLGSRSSFHLNALALMVWFFAALALSALFLWLSGYYRASGAGAGILAVLAAGIGIEARILSISPVRIVWLGVIQFCMTGLNITRIVLIGKGFGMALSALVAALMTLAGLAASASGIFPAGIGVGELLAAGIASVMALPPSVGFLVTSVNRLASWLALTAFLPLLFTRGQARRDDRRPGVGRDGDARKRSG